MRELTLGDVLLESGGSIKTGPFGTTLKAAEYSTDGVPVISVGEVGHGTLRIGAKTPRVGAGVTTRLPEYILEVGDVVFGRKGAVDRSAWVRPHEAGCFLGSDGIRVRFGRSVDSRFMAYQFRSGPTMEWLVQHAAGTTMASLNQPILERVPVVVPPLDEQRAIAEVLGALDDKIAANAALVATAEALMRSIAASTPERTTVSEVADQVTSQLRPESFAAAVAHFSLPAFDEGSPELTSGSSIMSNKFEFARPVVLMSKLNPRIPRLWNVPVLPQRMALASTEFVVLASKTTGVSALWSVLAQPEVWTRLKGKVAGTSGSHQRVKPAEILSLTVGDPRSLPKVRQHSLESLGLRCHAARGESDRLAATRDALLPGLMSGKIRVRDAEDAVGEAV